MENKKHYAWKIVLACILMKLGTGGFIGVAMGNFITPIVRELGCQVSQLTTYTSINAISMASRTGIPVVYVMSFSLESLLLFISAPT